MPFFAFPSVVRTVGKIVLWPFQVAVVNDLLKYGFIEVCMHVGNLVK